jgi:hypothetical protein
LTSGQIVERRPYDAVYQQRDPQAGTKLGRARGHCTKFADLLARLKATEPPGPGISPAVSSAISASVSPS